MGSEQLLATQCETLASDKVLTRMLDDIFSAGGTAG
jgi:hypothetical protein